MNVPCTQCGTPSPPGNRFCGRCGSPLPPSAGNLASSARPTHAPPGTAPPAAAPPTIGNPTPCWQCGTAVDPLHQASCPACGANLALSSAVAPAGPAVASGTFFADPGGAGPPAAPLGPPPPAAGPPPPFVGEPTAPRSRREPLVNGVVVTIIVAIVIVLVLAVAGIIAGQAIGR
jgi:hypothetical protein